MMLYLGLYSLMRVFSKSSASHSVSTTVTWMSRILLTSIRTFGESCVLLK